MNKEFKLPDVGEGLTEADIVSWHVKPGDTIEDGQVIVEIETAKAVVELPSPYAGTVTGLLVEEGQTVDVGTPIIAVDVGGTDGAAGKPAAEPAAAEPATAEAAAAQAAVQAATEPGATEPRCHEPKASCRKPPCRMPRRTLRRLGRRSSSATASSRDRRAAGRARSRRRGPGRIPRRRRCPQARCWRPPGSPAAGRSRGVGPREDSWRSRRCGGSPGTWASTCPR